MKPFLVTVMAIHSLELIWKLVLFLFSTNSESFRNSTALNSCTTWVRIYNICLSSASSVLHAFLFQSWSLFTADVISTSNFWGSTGEGKRAGEGGGCSFTVCCYVHTGKLFLYSPSWRHRSHSNGSVNLDVRKKEKLSCLLETLFSLRISLNQLSQLS